MQINSTIGFVEERNAGNAVKALMDSLAPKAKVKRDGSWKEIDVSSSLKPEPFQSDIQLTLSLTFNRLVCRTRPWRHGQSASIARQGVRMALTLRSPFLSASARADLVQARRRLPVRLSTHRGDRGVDGPGCAHRRVASRRQEAWRRGLLVSRIFTKLRLSLSLAAC